jgi:hypothetical protein
MGWLSVARSYLPGGQQPGLPEYVGVMQGMAPPKQWPGTAPSSTLCKRSIPLSDGVTTAKHR